MSPGIPYKICPDCGARTEDLRSHAFWAEVERVPGHKKLAQPKPTPGNRGQ